MSTTTIAKPCTEVTLIRPDGGSQTFTLPEGATLADLFREAGAAVGSPNLLIDGRPIEEVLVLKSGVVISIMPEPPRPHSNGSWQESIGTVQDTPAFRAMLAAGRAIREADREAASHQTDEDDA